ncbi:hypothetical protein JCM10449v2_005852 [Rhodotorula kratochvilovae]
MNTRSEAASATPAPPTALALPDEVWLLIADNLAYGSLKSLERTCKRLNKLTKDKSLDRVLFRTKAVKSKLAPGTHIELHPMLEAIECADINLSMRIFRRDDDDNTSEQTFNPYSLAAVDEFATSPACSKIHLSMLADFQVQDVRVIRAGGVTVRTLFHEMEAFWQNIANEDTCFYHGTSYDRGHTYGRLWDCSTYGMEGDVWSAPQVGMDGAITLSPYIGC